jgi:hypothetical protein
MNILKTYDGRYAKYSDYVQGYAVAGHLKTFFDFKTLSWHICIDPVLHVSTTDPVYVYDKDLADRIMTVSKYDFGNEKQFLNALHNIKFYDSEQDYRDKNRSR